MEKRNVRYEENLHDKKWLPRSRQLGIIGTGNFGRALAQRLVFSGYDVIIGSRRPSARWLLEDDRCLCKIQVASIKECVSNSDVIFLAVHFEHFKDTVEPVSDLLANKIVIDVSNRAKESGKISNAEYLQSILPKAKVVKAFNVISSYVMENDTAGGSRKVFVAGDDIASRDIVCNIAREMGFTTLDIAGLQSSRRIEAFVLNLFPGWKIPILITIVIFTIWCLFVAYVYYINEQIYKWDQLFIKVLNKPICMTAIFVLTLTYLPGCIAALLQVVYGTKYKRFPQWMDWWLKSRKQFGIICFVLVFTHVIMSILLMSPSYNTAWYQPTAVVVPANLTGDLHLPFKTYMKWNGEAAGLAGVLALIILCFIAVTTLPSVQDSLNWREWRFAQSTLGYVALLLSAAHVTFIGFPGWLKKGFPKSFGSVTFVSVLLPVVVLAFKLILILPCINRYVLKIRNGWERERQHSPTSGSNETRSGEECVALNEGP